MELQLVITNGIESVGISIANLPTDSKNQSVIISDEHFVDEFFFVGNVITDEFQRFSDGKIHR